MESSLQVKMSSPEPARSISPELPAAGRGKRQRRLPRHFHDFDLDKAPQIKEEHEGLLQSPVEVGGSTLTLLAVKSENDDDYRETMPLSSTSTDQLLSSYCSEPDIEDIQDSDGDWSQIWEDSLDLPVCEEVVSPEQQEMSSRLAREKPESPHNKEEQEELRQRLEEADGLTLLMTVESDNEDGYEYREAELVASTSTEDMTTDHHMERSTVSKEMASRRYSTLSEEQREMDRGRGLLDARLQPAVKLYRIDKAPQIKEEHEGLLQSTEEVGGSALMLLAVTSENDDENRETMPLSSTSTDQLLSSYCSEPDIEDTQDSDEDWSETWKGQSALNPLTPQTTQHEEGEGFNCRVCGKNCTTNGNLKQHMQTHTEDRPFSCDVCGKGFRQFGHVKSHMMIHTGLKPFTCAICGKACRHMSHLKLHMRVHSGEKPYICEVCGRTYRDSSHLKSHILTHTGEKPHICIVCEKRFGRKDYLDKHMRTHTGEKPYTCTICGKDYSLKCNLNTHLRTHSGRYMEASLHFPSQSELQIRSQSSAAV